MTIGDVANSLSLYYTGLVYKIKKWPSEDPSPKETLHELQVLRVTTAFYYFILEFVLNKKLKNREDPLTSEFFLSMITSHIKMLHYKGIYQYAPSMQPDLTVFGKGVGPYKSLILTLNNTLKPIAKQNGLLALSEVTKKLLGQGAMIVCPREVQPESTKQTLSPYLRLAHLNRAPVLKLVPPGEAAKQSLNQVLTNPFCLTVGDLMRILAGYARGIMESGCWLNEMDDLVDCEQAYTLLNQYIELGYYTPSTFAEDWGFFPEIIEVIQELCDKNIPCIYSTEPYEPIEKSNNLVLLGNIKTYLRTIIMDISETTHEAFATPEQSSQLYQAANNVYLEIERRENRAAKQCSVQ